MDLADAVEAAAGDLFDGVEVETVFEAGLPVAVFFAFFHGFHDLGHTGALDAELDGAEDETGDAEVVEVEGVSEELGFWGSRGAVGELEEEARGAVEEVVIGVFAEGGDEDLGGLLDPLTEVGAAQFTGGEKAAVAHGELKGEAGELEGVGVGGIGDEAHLDEGLDAAPEALGVIDEARTDHAVFIDDG
jgi:hypothetical protein